MPQVLWPKARATYSRHEVAQLAETPHYKTEGCWFWPHYGVRVDPVVNRPVRRADRQPYHLGTSNFYSCQGCHGRCRICFTFATSVV